MWRFACATTIVGVLVLRLLVIGATAQDGGRQAGDSENEQARLMVKVFTLEKANAEEMERIVNDLFGRPQSRQAFTRAPASRLRTSADPRTNSLIVVGPEQELAVIEALVVRLDKPTPKEQEKVNRVNEARVFGKRDEFRSDPARQARSGNSSAPTMLHKPAAAVSGTRIRVKARSPDGKPLVVKSVVAMGNKVKEGELLLALNTAPIEVAISAQQIKAHQAQSAVEHSKAALANLVLQQEIEQAEANQRIELAKLELREYLDGVRRLHLQIHQKELKQARLALDEVEELVQSGKADARTLERMRVEYELAQTKLVVFEKYTSPKSVKQLESAIVSADRHAQRVKKQAETDVKEAKAELSSRTAQADLEVSKLERLRHQLEMCNIVAPHDGVVVAAGPVPVRAGAQVRDGQVVLILRLEEANSK